MASALSAKSRKSSLIAPFLPNRSLLHAYVCHCHTTYDTTAPLSNSRSGDIGEHWLTERTVVGPRFPGAGHGLQSVCRHATDATGSYPTLLVGIGVSR